jgi:hypothetical protein
MNGYWLIEINLPAICIARVLDLFLSKSFYNMFHPLFSLLFYKDINIML